MLERGLIVVVLIAVAMATAKKDPQQRSYEEHRRRVASFPCSLPQRRAIPLTEIFKENLLSNEQKLVPSMTVLHRCDEAAGCCPQTHLSCAPATSEMVELVFHALPIRGGASTLKVAEAQNHTSCSCQLTTDQPK